MDCAQICIIFMLHIQKCTECYGGQSVAASCTINPVTHNHHP